MAISPPRIDTIPHHPGIGRMQRFASTIFTRARSDADIAHSLRGVLPLRYPGDAAGLDHDPLTGLASQPVFVASLGRWAARSAREGTPYSLVLIDVDHLGTINARRGHVRGDGLLRQIAQAMQQHASRQDRLSRIGGDEFAVLLAGTGPEAAQRRAEAMLSSLEMGADDDRPGSISAGIAGAPWSAREPDLVFRQAGAALADAKRSGGAGVVVFDPARHRSPAREKPAGVDLLERVMTDRLLRPVFQPIVDLRRGRILGFEGLVRVHLPKAGLGVSELFAAADATDRMAELDLACVDAVVAGARAIRPDRLLTLNLSPRTLARGTFDPAWLLQSLVRGGISPGRVIVELSDDVRVDDLGRLEAAVLELQRLGLRVAADDVSGDDPAKRLLTHLPFDIVKIDLTQVWEGAHTGPRLAILRDAALGRQARVVVEGVETSEQLVAVRDLEFGAGQGYLLGRPDSEVVEPVLDMERLEADDESPASAAPQETVVAADGPYDPIVAERLAVLLPPAPASREVEASPA